MSWFDNLVSGVGSFISGTGDVLTDVATGIFGDDVDLGALAGLIGSAAYKSGGVDPLLDILGLDFLQSDANAPRPAGYQGSIPNYVAVQERVPQSGIAPPRPGATGQRYFSDVIYAQKPESMMTPPTLEQARAMAQTQAQNLGIAALPTLPNPNPQGAPIRTGASYALPQPSGDSGGVMGAVRDMTSRRGPPVSADEARAVSSVVDSLTPQLLAAGGLASLGGKGYYLGGTTDGMADRVPASIDGKQEARLSDGEFVVPADVVSHLGNGNSNAGAQQLYAMMDKVRQDRTGRKEQGKQINPKRYMPGMGA